MSGKRKDYSNRRGGSLLLVSYARPGGPGVGAIWTATCDCGHIVEVIARDVVAGKRRTCGRCMSRLGIHGPEGVVAAGIPVGHRRPFRALIHTARKMPGGVQFCSTDYNRIRGLRCVACNVQPCVVEWADPAGPGDPTNLIPICPGCSEWRAGRKLEEYLKQSMRVANSIMRRHSNNSDQF